MCNARDAAAIYLEQGWKPLPVPPREKAPGAGWATYQATPEKILTDFDPDGNVGVRLGPDSGDLVDVDLDCPEARELAPGILPATLRFGRASAPGSHMLYRCPGAGSKAYPLKGEGHDTALELRAAGRQTVFPGSTHPSGEQIEFENTLEPVEVSLEELSAAVEILALQVAWVRAGLPRDMLDDVSPEDLSWLDMVPAETATQVRRWFRKAPAKTEERRPKSKVARAAAEWCAENPQDWNTYGRQCPICGHRKCFGPLPDDPQKWFCFSTSHAGAGVQGDNGWTGDAVDVFAHRAGLSVVAFLEQEGKLVHRPPIVVSKGSLYEAIDAAIETVADCGYMFSHGGRLTQVVVPKKITKRKQPQMVPVTSAMLLGPMSRERAWQRIKVTDGETEVVPCDPPPAVLNAVCSTVHAEGVPDLAGFSMMPVLLPDGSIRAEQGYDPDSETYITRDCSDIPILPEPTLQDARDAATALLEVVEDFPFESDVSRSVWLAFVLSKVGWSAYEGNAPMFLADSPTPAAGKGLVLDVGAIIATGHPIAKETYTDNDEEMSKRITSHMIAGTPIVMLDNVDRTLGGASLDSAITSEIYTGRILKESRNIRVPAATIWTATGNRLTVQGDLARRALRINLPTKLAHPELRTDCKHMPLEPWVMARQPELFGAAATILRAYIFAGKPRAQVTRLGSFEEWNNLVRGALIWIGQEDPVQGLVGNTREMDAAADSNTVLMAELSKIPEMLNGGMMSCDLVDRIARDHTGCRDLKQVILEMLPNKYGDLLTPKDVGFLFRKIRDRVVEVEGRQVRLGHRRKGTEPIRWVVEQISDE